MFSIFGIFITHCRLSYYLSKLIEIYLKGKTGFSRTLTVDSRARFMKKKSYNYRS